MKAIRRHLTETIGLAGILWAASAGAVVTEVRRQLAAKPGKVTLVMSNPSSVQHNVAIKGNGIKTVKGKVVGKGGTSKATASLKKGAYSFFCSVPGHEKGGMKGRLTVK